MSLAEYLDRFVDWAELHHAEHVHFFLEHRTDYYSSWRQQKEQQQTQQTLGLSVIIYNGEQQGFAATNQIVSESILTMLQRAMNKAGLMTSHKMASLARETLPQLELDRYNISGQVTTALYSSCSCDVFVWEQRQQIFSYDRLQGLQTDRRHRGSVVCEIASNDKFFIERSYGWADRPPELEQVACNLNNVVLQAEQELKRAEPLEEGRYAAVFYAAAAGMLFHELAHLLEARDGEPLWRPRLDVTKRLTLIDDPTILGRFGSQLYDDEGVHSQRVHLIENGQINAHLSHRYTKTKSNYPSNGHGRRQDFRFRPMSRMTNLVVLPGDLSLEQLITNVGEGLYIRKISGGNANHSTGMIELKIEEAFRIVGGAVTTPLEPFVISQHATSFLEGIHGVGLDVETFSVFCKGTSGNVPVSLTQPSIAIEGIQVKRRN